MPATDRSPADEPTTAPEPARSGSHEMDSRMMWVMMLGCCLAIPLALILGGAGLAGAGASPWFIGAAVILAIAVVVVVRRRSAATHCPMPSDDAR